MSGHPHANLIHSLNLWKLAIGIGCMGFASAWQKGRGQAEWSTFPVHKVNVSDSREITDQTHGAYFLHQTNVERKNV